MSASIVDHEHIHVLTWAASNPIAPPNCQMRWLYDNPTRVNQIEPDGSNRDEIGQMLLDENAASVNHLYSTDAAAGDYHYQRPQHTEWSTAELLNALHAYTYQACEHPGWQRSQANAFCDELRHRLISTLPGYNTGPWTITRASVPAIVTRARELRAAQQA
jgi:hypothetical protein